MFKENIINLSFWTMPIYKEYLNHTLGLTLSTPGLVDPKNDVAYVAKKHGLDKIIKETAYSKNILGRRIYECDICASSFIYKTSMISHKRDVHLYLSEI